MSIYYLNRAKYGTHNLIAEEIGQGKTILDVGCSEGFLKNLAPDNKYWGIEYDKIAAKKALKAKYIKVTIIDLNHDKIDIKKQFDIIVFGDILEHLINPELILKQFAKNNLAKGGKIIISLPNVSHVGIRLNLLRGKFEYTNNGILDKTHLHLYTINSAEDLINKCHLKIVKKKFSSNHFGKLLSLMPKFGSLFGHQLIFIAKK